MMTRNLKVFLAASVGSVSVWWGINALNEALTDVFFAYEMRTNPAVLAATAAQLEIEQQIQEAYPLAQKGGERLEIHAKAALALYAREDGTIKILFQKGGEKPLPIASITKLMTALVFLDHNPGWDKTITITATDQRDGGRVYLLPGEEVNLKDLFY